LTRVVITGAGVLAANGIGVESFWESLMHRRSGTVRVNAQGKISEDGYLVGLVQDFDAATTLNTAARKAARLSRTTQLAFGSAGELADSPRRKLGRVGRFRAGTAGDDLQGPPPHVALHHELC
jgi:3-oxoacyl-(acyl-carrier-protein) synthase